MNDKIKDQILIDGVWYDSPPAPWHIPGDLRPAAEIERLSVHAKLIAARAAMLVVREAVEQPRNPATGKRWSQRDRLEYIATICDNAIRRIG